MGGWPGGYDESRVSLKLGVSRDAVKGTLAGDESCSLPHTAQSTQSSPKASPFPKATGSDISLPLILKNSPVLTSSSSWTFLQLRQLPGTLLFCLPGVLSPQTFAKLTLFYPNVPSACKASSGHSI